jgi:hypothetical protein
MNKRKAKIVYLKWDRGDKIMCELQGPRLINKQKNKGKKKK